MAKPVKPIFWRQSVAKILDFFLVLGACGYPIAIFTGDTTEYGFRLNGVPALIVCAAVFAYFFVFNRYLGGTIFMRVFGIAGR